MRQKDLEIINTLLERTENLPDILHIRAAEIGYQETEDDKRLLLEAYQELDDILKEVAAFINVKFPGRQDFMKPWNEIDFDTKIGGLKIVTTDREHIKRAWNKGLFDLQSLIKSVRNEVVLLIDERNESKTEKESIQQIPNRSLTNTSIGKTGPSIIKEVLIGLFITILGGIVIWVLTEYAF